MNQPKKYTAAKIRDFGISQDLMDFIYDQMQEEYERHITKSWIADTLRMMKDAEYDMQDPSESPADLRKELAQFGSIVVKNKIDIVLL